MSMGNLDTKQLNYDGVACNDEGYYLAFGDKDASFEFKTPPNITGSALDEMTVEFWIKPDVKILEKDSTVIFTLKDNVETLNEVREGKNLEDF